MNDAAQLLKWSQQLGSTHHGRECCIKLLEAVAHQRLTLKVLHAAHILVPLCAALQSKVRLVALQPSSFTCKSRPRYM